MDLHLHLTVASRALDRKWGRPIDLEDDCTDFKTCLPAEIDLPSTTFSSEEYLRAVQRKYKTKRISVDSSSCRTVLTYEMVSSEDEILNAVFAPTEAVCCEKGSLTTAVMGERKAQPKSILKNLKNNLLLVKN